MKAKVAWLSEIKRSKDLSCYRLHARNVKTGGTWGDEGHRACHWRGPGKGKKGKGKGKGKKKYPNFNDLKKSAITLRSTLERKVFNPSFMRRVTDVI